MFAAGVRVTVVDTGVGCRFVQELEMDVGD